jgi:hypothetical protein
MLALEEVPVLKEVLVIRGVIVARGVLHFERRAEPAGGWKGSGGRIHLEGFVWKGRHGRVGKDGFG